MTANSVSYKSPPGSSSKRMAESGDALSLQPRRSPLLKPLYRRLDSYQKRGVDFALSVRTAALLFEQGTGKTWICGGIIEALMDHQFEGVLVVSLANLETTWVTFFADHLPELTICRSWDTFKVAPAPKLFLTHYEGMRKKGMAERVRRRGERMVFVGYDESQRLKNRTSLDSRIAAKLRACGKCRTILTGTPIDENPAELWAQFRFLREDVFGDTWSDFEDTFFEPLTDKQQSLKDRLGEVTPGSARWHMMMQQYGRLTSKRGFDFDKLDDFLDLVGPYAMRVTKEVLNLPPLNLHRVPLVMLGEQRRVYQDVAGDMVTLLGDTRLTTPMRVTQLGRLHQICGGYVPDDDGNMHEVGRTKMRRLLQLVAKKRKPIVVCCKYRTEIDEIVIELNLAGYAVSAIHGGIKKKERPAIIQAFQRGQYDVIVVQERTGGVGIDLFKSSVAIVYSLTYSRIDFEQFLARVHRRGQEFTVDVYLLYVAGTVDEDVYEAILRKDRITKKVLIELEQRRRQNGKERQGRREAGRRQGYQDEAGQGRRGI